MVGVFSSVRSEMSSVYTGVSVRLRFVAVCSTLGAFSVLCAFQAKELSNYAQQGVQDAKMDRENERAGLVAQQSAARPSESTSWAKMLFPGRGRGRGDDVGPPRTVSLELGARPSPENSANKGRGRQASKV